MGPIVRSPYHLGCKCAVCNREYVDVTTALVQIKYDTFVCKPCIAVWYNDWERMRNPWPHLPMYEGDDDDACDEPSETL